MSKITSTKVYDLEESIVASGLPMKPTYDEDLFEYEVECVKAYLQSKKTNTFPIDSDRVEEGRKHWRRIVKLGNCKPSTGHNSALKGILVNANFTFDQSFWQQFQRYHFCDILSSQSKQHRLIKMDIMSIKNVSNMVLLELNRMIMLYNMADTEVVDDGIKYSKTDYFERIIKSSPIGLELTARVTLNYLQLRTMVLQRAPHKMSDWHTVFINWCRSLPHADDLIFGGVE